MSNINKLFKSIFQGEKENADRVFNQIMAEKLTQAKEIRKVGLTAEIFNNGETVKESTELEERQDNEKSLSEAVSADKFVKGGNDKITQSDVDDLLGNIYDSSSLTKSLVRNKAYQEGEDNPKGTNPYKKDTFDYHLFLLGQQMEKSRS